MLTRRQRALLGLQEELIPPSARRIKPDSKSAVPTCAVPTTSALWSWKPMMMKPSKFPVTDVPVPYSSEFVSTWYSDISEDEAETPVPVPSSRDKVLRSKKDRVLGRC